MALLERIAQVRETRLAHLRHRISALEMEADAAEQHARSLRDVALDARAELYELEDHQSRTESD